MNHIHKLQREVRAANLEVQVLRNGLSEIVAYLNSSKFNCGNDLDGYVQVNDVLRRIEEAKSAAQEVK